MLSHPKALLFGEIQKERKGPSPNYPFLKEELHAEVSIIKDICNFLFTNCFFVYVGLADKTNIYEEAVNSSDNLVRIRNNIE